jgi:hypothetical protein
MSRIKNLLCVAASLQGRAPVRLDRNDIGRMKIGRTLIWAFRLAARVA